jgi:signal transduction histidine kinase
VDPLRILLVEDDPADAELLIREIRRSGCRAEFDRVQTAEAMRAALERDAWDAILADYSLPQFSGRAALALMHEMELDLPFIIVSGTVGEDTAVDAMRAGAHDFILKDRLARLVPAIEREVRDGASRREQLRARERIEAERERLLAQLQDTVRARDTFLGIASHELKTPVAILELQLHILRKYGSRDPGRNGSDDVGAALSAISRQTARLRMLIGNVLDVVDITSGEMALVRERVDVGEIANAVVTRVRCDQRPEPVIQLDAESVVSFWDRARIESVIWNLVSNAVKFGDGKPVDVAVKRNGSSMRLTVSDRGIGLSPEERDRIFDKFERAVSERQYGGLGLGLWIVRQIVEAHGGTIDVISEPARGSTFVVDLPLGDQTVNREPGTDAVRENS